jgi:hypothetical protein
MVSYMLLSPEGQRDEAWKPSKKQFLFGNRGEFYIKVLSFLCYYFEIQTLIIFTRNSPDMGAVVITT